MIKIALGALVVGITVPLVVQMYLTLRSLNRLVSTLDRRLDPTLRDLSQTLAQLKETSNPSLAASQLAAVLIPAIVAAVRSFRSNMNHSHNTEEKRHET